MNHQHMQKLWGELTSDEERMMVRSAIANLPHNCTAQDVARELERMASKMSGIAKMIGDKEWALDQEDPQ